MTKIVALITATGRGTRLSKSDEAIFVPKQYLSLNNISVLRHSILAFLNHPKISDVICTINPEDVELYEKATKDLKLLKPVFGGETRQISVRKGLENLQDYNPDFVLIHDAVRPFVTTEIIDKVIEKLQTSPAVIPAIAVEDTLKKYQDGKIEWTLERQNLWRAQTPQGFKFQNILKSHIAFQNQHFTDDAAIEEYAGIPVAIIDGSQNNFKITTIEDFERAKKIMENMRENRIGSGFDVHKFATEESPDNFVVIGGVKIPYKKKVLAHSDGDVAIHAVMDALLGALSLGDIGQHFPPSDDKWKNIDSTKMLKIVADLLKEKSAKIINIDVTIICEKPKVLNYKNQMVEILAQALEIEQNRINIKATTTEKLGFLGREEGVAAQAIALVNI